MILGIRTDKPEAELYLLNRDGAIENSLTWHGHRQLSETLHTKIKELLHEQNIELNDLTGIVVYQGPGSFTGLRISVSVANALRSGLQLPVVGGKGDNWYLEGVQKLEDGADEEIVVPDYGREPHITTPKK